MKLEAQSWEYNFRQQPKKKCSFFVTVLMFGDWNPLKTTHLMMLKKYDVILKGRVANHCYFDLFEEGSLYKYPQCCLRYPAPYILDIIREAAK